MKVIEVTRTATKATPEELWALWADPHKGKAWDDAQEWASVSGPFGLGQTGEVKVRGQAPRRFKITEFEPYRVYTDEFYLPARARMVWRHLLNETRDGVQVTFRVEVAGPTAFLLQPVMKRLLERELPPTVEKFIAVAERHLSRPATTPQDPPSDR